MQCMHRSVLTSPCPTAALPALLPAPLQLCMHLSLPHCSSACTSPCPTAALPAPLHLNVQPNAPHPLADQPSLPCGTALQLACCYWGTQHIDSTGRTILQQRSSDLKQRNA